MDSGCPSGFTRIGGMNMNERQQFMQLDQILAANDLYIIEAVEQVQTEAGSQVPGGAAQEFVASMERLRTSDDQNHRCIVVNTDQGPVPKSVPPPHSMSLPNALRIKSAEYWIKLGQPLQALIELQRLPKAARKNPWAMRVHMRALGAVREMNCRAHVE